MKLGPILVAPLLLALPLSAQQQTWQALGPLNHYYQYVQPFSDFDRDGLRDVLVLVFPNIGTSNQQEMRILSGADGNTLWSMLTNARSVHYGGDVDGDGMPEIAVQLPGPGTSNMTVTMWSTATSQPLWGATGSWAGQFGDATLCGIDTDGDGFDDLVACETHPNQSSINVYDHLGALRYSYFLTPHGWQAWSLAAMGDMNGDGADDFLVGCAELTGRGAMVLISGLDGAILRISYGLLPGDLMAAHATNLGDIDGDGINDYAGFPHWSAWRAIIVLFSGATGNVIRTLPLFGDGVVAEADVDLDGVNDLVIGSDYVVLYPNVYGRTMAISGRDGTELWRVDNFLNSGQPSSGWMRQAAPIGVAPGSPYPIVAWFDLNYWEPWLWNGAGRIRAFHGTRAGQGPVTGTPCTSTGTLPLIGVRDTDTGSRITIAKSHSNALGALWLSLNPLPVPVDLSSLGASGCNLYVNADATWLRTLGTTGIDRGYAAVDLSVHLAATLGTVVSAQWLVLDPVTLDHAVTARHELRLQ